MCQLTISVLRCAILRWGNQSGTWIKCLYGAFFYWNLCYKMEDEIQVFDHICVPNVLAWNSLAVGYAQCGRLEHSRWLFDMIPERDVVSWSTLIGIYILHGYSEESIQQFFEMHSFGMRLNYITFTSALNACYITLHWERKTSTLLDNHKWTWIDVLFRISLADMYTKCVGA